MYILLTIIGCLQVIALIYIIKHVLLSDNHPMLVLLCPTYTMCSEFARITDMNIVGTITTTILWTIVVLPALAAYYVIAFLCFGIFGIVMLWCLIFRKK